MFGSNKPDDDGLEIPIIVYWSQPEAEEDDDSAQIDIEELENSEDTDSFETDSGQTEDLEAEDDAVATIDSVEELMENLGMLLGVDDPVEAAAAS